MNKKIRVVGREKGKKSHVNHIRNSGGIPAVLYGTKQNQLLTIDAKEFTKFYSSLEKGHLPNTTFEIDLNGKRTVLVKSIEYDVITNQVKHIDLMDVENRKIKIKVPFKIVGHNDSPGITLGGSVRDILRHVQVETTLECIPEQFVIDISGRELDESIKVSDIKQTDGVTILNKQTDVIAVITKK